MCSTMPQAAKVVTPTVTATESAIPTSPHNGREARNLAEKHRRDKLNASIQELAKMVPHVAGSNRRCDKTAVLRFAAHGLRLKYVFGRAADRVQANEKLCSKNVSAIQPQLTDTLMQLLDSFFITMTCHGQIVLISSSVEQLLGHCQSDLYGQNILHIVHPEDQELMLQQLIPRNMEDLFRNDDGEGDGDEEIPLAKDKMDADDDDGNVGVGLDERPEQGNGSRSTHNFDDIDKCLREDRRCFTVRLARAGTRSESARKYEIVMIDGLFRRSDCSTSAGCFPIVSQLIRRSRNGGNGFGTYVPNGSHWVQHDAAIAQAALHGISGNDIVLVAMARVIRPPKITARLLEANALEYRTRHLIDGRIVDCDQRIGLVAGYMKDEVRNLCPFTFMHQDDVRWVIVALRQMYDCNSNYGESCYRLLSRNGHFIYLQTKGYLEIDKDTNKVHSFVCVNTLLDEEEGRFRVQEMKKKFSIIIKAKIPSNSLEDVPASQNPQQLERIVLYLIENLQKRNDNLGNMSSSSASSSSSSSSSTAHAYNALNGNSDSLQSIDESVPLALVPPEPDSVKSSISKSVSIVNVTAARNLQYNLKSPASYQSSEISLSPANSLDHHDEIYVMPITPPPSISLSPKSQRPSVLVQTNELPVQQQQQQQQKKQQQSQEQCKTALNTITAKPTTLVISGTKTESKIIPNSSPTKHVILQLQQSKQKNISMLKRMQPPSNNSSMEECISPAKRSPPTPLTPTKINETQFMVISPQKSNNGNKFINYTCSTMPTLLEQQLRLPKTTLLNSIKNEQEKRVIEQPKITPSKKNVCD